MLEISHLSKTYPGGKKGGGGFVFSVQSGEIVGFIGHNGAGKTTTLRCSGHFGLYAGHDYHRRARHPHRTGFGKTDYGVPAGQSRIYTSFLTGIAYLKFIADLYSIPKQERTQRIGSMRMLLK